MDRGRTFSFEWIKIALLCHFFIGIEFGKLFIKIYFGKDTTGIKLEKDNINSLYT